MDSLGAIVGAERLGSRAGAYRLVRVLGHGGMGVVYEAVHETIGQRAAAKVLLGDLSRTPTYKARFAREARIACAVRHPSLVQVFDSGELEDGTPFLLMEYLEGELLRARLAARGVPPVDEALRIARQLASALAAVHAAGIIHRDVKPDNIMLIRDEAVEGGVRVKLLDFGIARRGTDASVLTQEGSVIGTPAYMAPEQCAPGGVVAAASDVYALGVIVFELFAGVPPFSGDAASVMQCHLVLEPPMHKVPLAPGSVRTILQALLDKDPARRPSAGDAGVQLATIGAARDREAFLQTAPQPQSTAPPAVHSTLSPLARRRTSGAPTPRSRWRMVRIGAFAVGGLALAGGGIARWRTARRPLPTLSGMVRLEGGHFVMGRSAVEADAECAALGADCLHNVVEREQPPRKVRLAPFYLDVNEVTNKNFGYWLYNMRPNLRIEREPESQEPNWVLATEGNVRLVLLTGPYAGIVVGPDGMIAVREGQGDAPVVQITWDAARMFCAASGKRLPTEAEWEFAARGKTSRHFPWGDAPPTCDGAVFARFSKEEGGACLGREQGPMPISGSTQDWTPEGVHDLFGNVQEWVEDAFLIPYYPDCGACENPVVESDAHDVNEHRVVRGGAWTNSIFGGTSARARFPRSGVAAGIGVRCALTAR